MDAKNLLENVASAILSSNLSPPSIRLAIPVLDKMSIHHIAILILFRWLSLMPHSLSGSRTVPFLIQLTSMLDYLKRMTSLNRERIFRLLRSRALSKLDLQYEKQNLSSHWPPIPPPSLNFNQDTASSIEDYKAAYFEAAREKELPFLASVAHLNPKCSTLDYGCGLGRLAAAFADSENRFGSYFGWEPEPQALRWLQSAYENSLGFRFDGTQLINNMNYVTNRGNYSTVEENFESRSEAVPSVTDLLRLMNGVKFNLQFSSSVFTHMWSSDIALTLKSFNDVASDNALFVNTWLIVDLYAQTSLDRGEADRILPIEINGALTYSQSNPLVCTAYRQKDVERMYRESGHQILEILYGSWSGRSNGVTYQDIVVSKRI
jgi:SAM-dependent methyltransferase